jgi:hypothetical protein
VIRAIGVERETIGPILHVRRRSLCGTWYRGGRGSGGWRRFLSQEVSSLPRCRGRGEEQVGSGVQNSPAGKSADFARDLTSFAAFIANPRGKIPGNKMVFVGIKDETEIANPWAYLSHFNVDGSSK